MLALFRMLLQGLSRMPGQLSLLCPLLKSEDRAGLRVSFPDGMVLCKPGWELGLLPENFCRAMLVLLRLRCCMGYKVQSWRRAVPAMDVDDVRCVNVPVRQACSVCVSGSAVCVLEDRNLEVCSSLCPW